MQPITGRSEGALKPNALALSAVNQYGIVAAAAAAVEVWRKSRRVVA
jgi:hypothetical protein